MSSMEEQHLAINASELDIDTIVTNTDYQQGDCQWFYTKDDPNWLLSNMAGRMPITLVSRNEKWGSSEKLYQACKYARDIECVPADKQDDMAFQANVRERIYQQKAPRGSKLTQKCAANAGLVRGDWDDPTLQVRIHAMLWVLEWKLRYNPFTFGNCLKATGTNPIVEISSRDTFWGCRITSQSGQLQGQNVLGKLLTYLRDERYESVKRNKSSYPCGFLLD